jgi:hypothetical protein
MRLFLSWIKINVPASVFSYVRGTIELEFTVACSQLTHSEILLCSGAHARRAGEDGFVTRTPVLAGQIMKGSIFSTEHNTSTDGLIAETAIINYSLSFVDQAKQISVFHFRCSKQTKLSCFQRK